MIKYFRNLLKNLLESQLPDYKFYKSIHSQVRVGKNVKLYSPVRLFNVAIGDYSYVGMYSKLKNVSIGKFCSIGPNCLMGWGIHPINGISTSPMFYSNGKQNGMTLSKENKVTEQRQIIIGNDVFIGMNVTILDGVEIGNGAVIGAGAVVSKNIPAFAVAVGNPIRIIKYRFSEEIGKKLNELKWWDFEERDLQIIEQNFFDVDKFLELNKDRQHD
jgi:virginiamycin A acetyltransferase